MGHGCTPASLDYPLVGQVLALVLLAGQDLRGVEQQEGCKAQVHVAEVLHKLCAQRNHNEAQHRRRRHPIRQHLRWQPSFGTTEFVPELADSVVSAHAATVHQGKLSSVS